MPGMRKDILLNMTLYNKVN